MITLKITTKAGSVVSLAIPEDGTEVKLEAPKQKIPMVEPVEEFKDELEPDPAPVVEPDDLDMNTCPLHLFPFPCQGHNTYRCNKVLLAQFTSVFSESAVRQEFIKARLWLVSNPQKQKTVMGMTRFLNNWLCSNNNMPKVPLKEVQKGGLLVDGKQNAAW
jgi:hypothetical protein